MDEPSLYDTDIVAWSQEQSRAVRELARRPGLTNALDWTNIAEEIESVGRSQVAGVERKLVLILTHLMKVISAPDSPAARGWRTEITTFQRVARKQYAPSMRRLLDPASMWTDARREAELALAEWGDPLARELPAASPFGLDDLLAEDFDADLALAALAAGLGGRS